MLESESGLIEDLYKTEQWAKTGLKAVKVQSKTWHLPIYFLFLVQMTPLKSLACVWFCPVLGCHKVLSGSK